MKKKVQKYNKRKRKFPLQRKKRRTIKSMSRSQYRKHLRQLNLIEDDQDVFHIISTKNGGVDHPDNFHYAQNGSYNRAIGYKFDHVNCYLAGRKKASKAVRICKKIGKYSGPSASVLYHQGEEFWRAARHHSKKTKK